MGLEVTQEKFELKGYKLCVVPSFLLSERTDSAFLIHSQNENDKVTSLPPIGDIQHPLYKYFDAGLHTQCFENWDKKEEVIEVIKEAKQKFINSDYFKEMILKFGKPKWLDEME